MRINDTTTKLIASAAVDENMNKFNKLISQKSSAFSAYSYSELGDELHLILESKMASDFEHEIATRRSFIYNDLHSIENGIKKIQEIASASKVEIIRMSQGYTDDIAIVSSGRVLKENLQQIIGILNSKNTKGAYIFGGYNTDSTPVDYNKLIKTNYYDGSYDPIKPSYYHGSYERYQYYIPDTKQKIATVNANSHGIERLLFGLNRIIQTLEQEEGAKGLRHTRDLIPESIKLFSEIAERIIPGYISNIGIIYKQFNEYNNRIKTKSYSLRDEMLGVNDTKKVKIIQSLVSSHESIQASLEISKRLAKNTITLINSMSLR